MQMYLVCSEGKTERDDRGLRWLVFAFYPHSPTGGNFAPKRYQSFIYLHVFMRAEPGRLTFAVSQTAVVAHRAEVLEYKHSYC